VELEDADGDVCARFVEDFVELWGSRFWRLSNALAKQNSEDALDAVLSLKCSASMVGALRLSRLAEELENEIRLYQPARLQALLYDIRSCGTLTMNELRQPPVRRL
jgi:HPt (histidine-containing phosphotransfer) domain-containing protein